MRPMRNLDARIANAALRPRHGRSSKLPQWPATPQQTILLPRSVHHCPRPLGCTDGAQLAPPCSASLWRTYDTRARITVHVADPCRFTVTGLLPSDSEFPASHPGQKPSSVLVRKLESGAETAAGGVARTHSGRQITWVWFRPATPVEKTWYPTTPAAARRMAAPLTTTTPRSSCTHSWLS